MHASAFVASEALLPDGWARDVRIDVTPDGTIARITPDTAPENRRAATPLAGPVLPGMPNVHSHAFQRAFAGRAERAIDGADSFWSWRQAMYGLAGRITPDDLEAIASQLYVEMLEAGYTAVGEFHYVHHDIGGVRFGVRSEMSQRLIAAAEHSGIGLTLLPVLYRWSGFGAQPPLAEQTRFINNVDDFIAIFDQLAPLTRSPQTRLGIALHSLRAVAPADISAVFTALDERDPRAPIHIHVAEQRAEVEASFAASGMRPVEWLLAHAAVDERWCFVHATHMNVAEIDALAASGATVGICPSTEGNLGDGIFALAPWLGHGGAIGIGSDSHVTLDVCEELRWLEYGQRLAHERRTVAPSPTALYVAAARYGGRALGRPIGALRAGARADFVVLDGEHPALAGSERATVGDRHVIAGGQRCIRDVYVGGVRVVEAGRHPQRDTIAARYRATLARLAP